MSQIVLQTSSRCIADKPQTCRRHFAVSCRRQGEGASFVRHFHPVYSVRSFRMTQGCLRQPKKITADLLREPESIADRPGELNSTQLPRSVGDKDLDIRWPTGVKAKKSHNANKKNHNTNKKATTQIRKH